MPASLAAALTVAVGIIALVQIGLLIVATSAIRRLDAEMSALSRALLTALQRVEETAAEVGDLTADVRETVGHARQAAAHVGAVMDAGRSLVEGALGSALLRGFGLGKSRAGGAAAQAVLAAAVAVWKALRARRSPSTSPSAETAAAHAVGSGRAPRPEAGAATAPQRTPLRAGRARRVTSQDVSLPGEGAPPVPPMPMGGGPSIGA